MASTRQNEMESCKRARPGPLHLNVRLRFEELERRRLLASVASFSGSSEGVILSDTQAGAVAAANTLVTPGSFGGQAAAFLTSPELESLVNFQFSVVPPKVQFLGDTLLPAVTARASWTWPTTT